MLCNVNENYPTLNAILNQNDITRINKCRSFMVLKSAPGFKLLFCKSKYPTSGCTCSNLAMTLDAQFSAKRTHSGESGGGGHCCV